MPALVFPIFWVGFWVQFLSQTHGPKIPHENKYRINYIMHVDGIGYEGPSVGPILTLWEDE